MTHTTFDAIVRGTGDGQSRRMALKALGAAALATAVGAPRATAAKKGKNGNSKKKALKLCRKQVGQCLVAIDALCKGDAGCEAPLVPCCNVLARCDAGGFIECVSSTDASN